VGLLVPRLRTHLTQPEREQSLRLIGLRCGVVRVGMRGVTRGGGGTSA
jgi:hypothetical protein